VAKYIALLNNFQGGELSERLSGRQDLPQVQAGCLQMKNFLPHVLGGATLRSGTYYVGAPRLGNKAVLFPFYNAAGEAYLIEFTAVFLRIWKNDALLQSGGSPIEIATPYAEADLPSLKAAQVGSDLWVVHPSYQPRALVRTSDTSWAFNTITFTGVSFSTSGNYPSSVGVYNGRAVLAATNNDPYTIWLSRPPDSATGATRYTDFTLGTNPSDAIVLVESDMKGSRILWLETQYLIFIGTDRGEYTSTKDLPIPASFDLQRQAEYGCESVQAVSAEGGVVYVRRGARQIGYLYYAGDTGRATPLNLTLLSDHITAPGIAELEVMQNPWPYLIARKTNGELLACALNIQGGVYPWSRFMLGGPSANVENMVVIRGPDNMDVLYLSVQRANGRTLEKWKIETAETSEDAHFIDCGVVKTYGTETYTVTGLTHLEGQTVNGVGDGGVLPDRVVSSGQVTYERASKVFHIGYAYSALLAPFPLTVPLDASGGSTKLKRISKVMLRVYKSMGGLIGESEDTAERLLTIQGGDLIGEPVPIYTGLIDRSFPGSMAKEVKVVLKQDLPLPFTVLSIMPEIEVQV